MNGLGARAHCGVPRRDAELFAACGTPEARSGRQRFDMSGGDCGDRGAALCQVTELADRGSRLGVLLGPRGRWVDLHHSDALWVNQMCNRVGWTAGRAGGEGLWWGCCGCRAVRRGRGSWWGWRWRGRGAAAGGGGAVRFSADGAGPGGCALVPGGLPAVPGGAGAADRGAGGGPAGRAGRRTCSGRCSRRTGTRSGCGTRWRGRLPDTRVEVDAGDRGRVGGAVGAAAGSGDGRGAGAAGGGVRADPPGDRGPGPGAGAARGGCGCCW